MCGMNWYREQMALAEDDVKRLSQLLAMMEDRYKLSQLSPAELEKVNPEIISVYQEIISRKSLLLKKSL